VFVPATVKTGGISAWARKCVKFAKIGKDVFTSAKRQKTAKSGFEPW
jgi:hypothetical protein